MTSDDESMPPDRTITDADARAIAKALFAEATKQVLLATGRGVWSTLKAAFFPFLLAMIILWLTLQGRIALPKGVH